MTPLAWRRIVAYALVGTALTTLAVALDVRRVGNNPLELIEAGRDSAAVHVLEHDFPGAYIAPGLGHDGQNFYVIARQPMHLRGAAAGLDRPRYRLQRPLMSWLAWALHPTGGGRGLLFALLAVGVAALAAGAIATGALSTMAGGPVWAGAVFAVLPGSYAALRLSFADTLALSLALVAVAASLRQRDGRAVVAGVAAVLAKEAILLVLVGYALWRRGRPGVAIAAVPAAVAAGLAALLRLTVPARGHAVEEFTMPFRGVAQAASRFWVHGQELPAVMSLVAAALIAVVAVALRSWRGPFGWAVVIELAFLPLLTQRVLGPSFNGTRMATPLLVVSSLAVVDACTGFRLAAERSTA